MEMFTMLSLNSPSYLSPLSKIATPFPCLRPAVHSPSYFRRNPCFVLNTPIPWGYTHNPERTDDKKRMKNCCTEVQYNKIMRLRVSVWLDRSGSNGPCHLSKCPHKRNHQHTFVYPCPLFCHLSIPLRIHHFWLRSISHFRSSENFKVNKERERVSGYCVCVCVCVQLQQLMDIIHDRLSTLQHKGNRHCTSSSHVLTESLDWRVPHI